MPFTTSAGPFVGGRLPQKKAEKRGRCEDISNWLKPPPSTAQSCCEGDGPRCSAGHQGQPVGLHVVSCQAEDKGSSSGGSGSSSSFSSLSTSRPDSKVRGHPGQITATTAVHTFSGGREEETRGLALAE